VESLAISVDFLLSSHQKLVNQNFGDSVGNLF
jgi:hypothetical protein